MLSKHSLKKTEKPSGHPVVSYPKRMNMDNSRSPQPDPVTVCHRLPPLVQGIQTQTLLFQGQLKTL